MSYEQNTVCEKQRNNKYAYFSVDIFDQFIDIFKMQRCILIMKIAAKSHHDMICCIAKCLEYKWIVIVHCKLYCFQSNMLHIFLIQTSSRAA